MSGAEISKNLLIPVFLGGIPTLSEIYDKVMMRKGIGMYQKLCLFNLIPKMRITAFLCKLS